MKVDEGIRMGRRRLVKVLRESVEEALSDAIAAAMKAKGLSPGELSVRSFLFVSESSWKAYANGSRLATLVSLPIAATLLGKIKIVIRYRNRVIGRIIVEADLTELLRDCVDSIQT